jgi:T-complex protein 1 subunit delta
MAVDAVMQIIDKEVDTNCDLRDIRVETCLGGTIDDSELIDGLVFVDKKISHQAGGPSKI